MRNAFIVTVLFLTGCSSIPKLKDFNAIEIGMSKAQVIERLGEPQTKEASEGREILVYEALDGSEIKPRWVVMEDREVVFYGRPGEYRREQDKRTSSFDRPVINNTNNVNVTGFTPSNAPITPGLSGNSQPLGESRRYFVEHPGGN